MTASNSPPPHDFAVLIGRFQPFHNGHLSLLKLALDAAPHVVVVIGSAFQALSPKHPFSWQERAEMIRHAVPEAERARLRFVPVRDYFDEMRWVDAVRREVAQVLAGDDAGPGPPGSYSAQRTGTRSVLPAQAQRFQPRPATRRWPHSTVLLPRGSIARPAGAARTAA